jgi:hypothetical protein
MKTSKRFLILLPVVLCLILVLTPPGDERQLQQNDDVGQSIETSSISDADLDPDREPQSAKPELQNKETTASRTTSTATWRRFGLQTLDPQRWRAAPNTKIYYATDAILREDPEKYAHFHPGNPWAHENLDFLPSVTTDGYGNAVFRMPGDVGYLYCRYDGTRGWMKLSLRGLNDAEITNERILYLYPSKNYVVDVSNASGEPVAGVPLRMAKSKMAWSQSGHDGKAYLSVPPEHKGSVSLTSYLPLLRPTGGDIPIPKPQAPGKFQLPPCGGVTLRAPPGDEGNFYLRCINPKTPWVRMAPDYADDSNQLRYDFVPLSKNIEICVATENPDQADVPILISEKGPKEDGEVVALDWSDSPVCSVRGRLYSEDGKPWGLHNFTLYAFNKRGGLLAEGISIQCNPKGRFEVYLHPDRLDIQAVDSIWIRTDYKHAALKDYLATDLKLRKGGSVSLGNLLPAPHTDWTAGEIVNAVGDPIPSAAVTYSWNPDVATRGGVDWSFHLGEAVIVGEGRNEFQIPSPVFPFACDWNLHVEENRNYNPVNKVVAAGSEGHRIVLPASFDLRWSYYPPLTGQALGFSLTRTDGKEFRSAAEGRRGFRMNEGPGKVRNEEFSDVEEGVFTFLATGETGDVLLEIPRLVIRKDQTRPAELQNLNLRGNDAAVLLLQLDGRPPPDGFGTQNDLRLFQRPYDGATKATGIGLEGDNVFVHSSAFEHECILAVKGYYPESIQGRGNGDTINLKPLPEIELVFPALAKVPATVECVINVHELGSNSLRGLDRHVESLIKVSPEVYRFRYQPLGRFGITYQMWEKKRGGYPRESGTGVAIQLAENESRSRIEVDLGPEFWERLDKLK